MSPTASGQTSRRTAENDLYDLGCDLVEAAAGIAVRAADPRAARAVPALLGCIEAALKELSSASSALQYAESPASDARGRALADRLDRGYTNLFVALQDARDASHAVRALAARYAAEQGDHGRPAG